MRFAGILEWPFLAEERGFAVSHAPGTEYSHWFNSIRFRAMDNRSCRRKTRTSPPRSLGLQHFHEVRWIRQEKPGLARGKYRDIPATADNFCRWSTPQSTEAAIIATQRKTHIGGYGEQVRNGATVPLHNKGPAGLSPPPTAEGDRGKFRGFPGRHPAGPSHGPMQVVPHSRTMNRLLSSSSPTQ